MAGMPSKRLKIWTVPSTGTMNEEIAIIGIGCNFPGGEGLENFWKVLVEGRNCAVQIPEERFDVSEWFHADQTRPGKSQTAKAALIDGFNEFDHKFFGISEAEALYMDPQQKLLLQCAYRTLEDAGIPLEKISGTKTGVYIGLMNRDYETLLNNSPTTITHYNGTGTAMSIAANRISYVFNLTGPSFAIDSACSSSLVALHSACQALRQGDCEMALCGGVSCILEPRVFVALSKAKMISPEGTSKAFCRTADGYGRGEGCGLVLLKPLKKALEDFNHIWGVVAKTAINQDGHDVSPITKPSMTQQEALLDMVYSAKDYLDVQYIEAHGTGTPAGDPVEAGSISKVIAKTRSSASGPLIVGSVKSNIGHTESAAGVAGLIKILLMMKHETIVPSVFYSAENSSIDATALDLRIPTKAEKWLYSGSKKRMAGLNSFGFGGTNAHAIITDYAHTTVPDVHMPSRDSLKLLPFSAATETSLQLCIADTYQRILEDKAVDLQALSFTAACRRSHVKHKFRKVFTASSLPELKSLLKSSLNKKCPPTPQDLKLVFVFCGNGVTYHGMCKQLLKDEPVFRNKFKEVENYLHKFRILDKHNSYDKDNLSKPNVVQPLLFALQVAIVHLLKHWGVEPDAVLGHSVGEVAAAHCSGLLSLEDAVKVIHHRSVLQSQVTGGKMLVVGNVPVTAIQEFLLPYTGKICLAALNSSTSCVLSGEKEPVDDLHQKLQLSFQTRNIFLHVLDVPAAYHSHMMDPILGQIKDSIGCLTKNETVCELISTVTGKACHHGDFVTGEYWARNIRQPVAFKQAVESLSTPKKPLVFVEIGPRRALQRNIMEILGNDTTVLPSVQPDREHETIFSTVAKLFELGVNMDWDNFYKGSEKVVSTFPVYQFECQKNKVRFEEVRRGHEKESSCTHPLISPSRRESKIVTCNLSTLTSAYLWEHKNNGISIAPGSLFVELALASVVGTAVPKRPLFSLRLAITFQSLLVVSRNSSDVKVTLNPSRDETTFKIHTSNTVHSSGNVKQVQGPATLEHQSIHLNAILKRCQLVISSQEIYSTLKDVGFEYGLDYKQLCDIRYGQEFKEALTSVTIPEGILKDLYDYCLHPVVLDYFLQMSSVVALASSTTRPGFPSAIGSMVVASPPHREMFIYMCLTKEMPDYFEVCGCFTDKDGRVLIELNDVRIQFLDKQAQISQSCFFNNLSFAVGVEHSLTSQIKTLVFEDGLGIAKSLKQFLHPNSVYVPPIDVTKIADLDILLSSLCISVDMEFDEVLFVWGVQNLTYLCPEDILQSLVNCCELYRQVVVTLRQRSHARSIRVVTYRMAEGTIDSISPGFVLSGMTRAFAAELSDFSFQLIDLSTVSREDLESLACVLHTYKTHECPEVFIEKGKAYSAMVARTPISAIKESQAESNQPESKMNQKELRSKDFTLQTVDPYKIMSLSALPSDHSVSDIESKCVEVKLCKICLHSSDYFPVSTSDLSHRKTIYWNKHTTGNNHPLLALDFSGTVTAVGKDVRKLKVGDHVLCCYPVQAASSVILPEAVCFKKKQLSFLKDIPCVSYLVLIWEILHCFLPTNKRQKSLTIFSSVHDSTLVELLTHLAKKSGWDVTDPRDPVQKTNHCHLFVLLPPFNQIELAEVVSAAKANCILVVLGDQEPGQFISDAMRNDRVCIQTLEMSTIFQKSRIIRFRTPLKNWLKGMRLHKKWPLIPSKTLQIDSFADPVDHSTSYFTAKTLELVDLSSDDPKCNMSAIPWLANTKIFEKTGVYIVSGGLSGLGFETVKFISARGGGNIVTLSRSGPSEKLQETIRCLQRRHGVNILPIQCDVSMSDQVMKALAGIQRHLPSCPIRGVFHSAAVLHDGLLETLDRSLFQKVLRPKICGALNLHFATKAIPTLDYFVCYSSISSFIGNAAQANYAAANSFLDAFCHFRRNSGLAGQSINWGPLNVGLLMNKEHFQKFLETKGMVIMNVPEIHEALEQCLLAGNPQQAICKFNFRNLKNHVFSQNASLKFRLSALVEKELTSKSVDDSDVPLCPSVDDCVKGILVDICSVDREDLQDGTTLAALGMDSMLAMTIQNRLFQEMSVNVPLVSILDPNSTVSSLIGFIKQNSDCDCEITVRF